MTERPILMKYLHALDYLRDLYQYRKSRDEGFSYQAWAEELGFKNRSFLRLIIMGQRPITGRSRDLLAAGLKLRGLERDYFETLISYGQSKTPEKKNALQAKLLTILRGYHDQTEVADAAELLANPHMPTLQVLLSFKDVLKTPEALAPLFSVSPETVGEWLETLQRLKLAEKSESGEWGSSHQILKVPDSLGHLPLQRYNSETLQKAAQAVHLPPETRRFRTLMMALSEADYQGFLTELNDFAVRLLNRYNHSELSERRLYQFTSALFPVFSPGTRVQMNSKQPRDPASASPAENLNI